MQCDPQDTGRVVTLPEIINIYICISWRQRQETNETKNGNKCNGNNNESKKEEKKIRHAYTFGKRQKEEKTMNKTKGTSQQHQQSNISGTKESE